MRIITVAPGSITPVSTQPEVQPSAQPLKARHPGERATKELYLGRIRTHLERLKQHLRNGDRRLVTPEAMLWVDRSFPSKTNTLDVLRGIEMILSRGVPPLVENPKELARLRSAFTQWLSRAKELWARGAGGQLPRTAYSAADTNPETATIAELKAAIIGLGGTL